MTRILLVSNGHGEDAIATHIYTALRPLGTYTFHAFPLVGQGLAYLNHSITPLINNPLFPSGGFIRGAKDFIKDANNGIISHTYHQLKLAKKINKKIDIIICIGDVFCLLIGSLGFKGPVFFIPSAKSDTFMPHSWIEKYWIKRTCKATFARDKQTATGLSKSGITSPFFGNPMMDGLQSTGETFGFTDNQQVIGILPGSRQEAYENLLFCLSCIEAYHKHSPNSGYVCALAPSLCLSTLQKTLKYHPWHVDISTQTLRHVSDPIHIRLSHQFINVVHRSNALIGLSGTANEQAVFMGKQVVCFEGFGPQTTLKRFREQQQLLGKGLHLVEPRDVQKIIQTLHTITQIPPLPSPPVQHASDDIAQYIHAYLNT